VLQTKDPRIVAKYIKKLNDQLEKHKVSPKLQELYLLESHQWTDQTQQTYERLDKIITEAMLYAEEASAKKYTNKYEWSPSLVRSVHAERFWRLALRKSQGRLISQNLFERTRLSAGIHVDPTTLAMPDVIQCLACARQTRKELQQQHQLLRKNYLEKLAEALVLKRAPYLDTDPKYEERLTQRTTKEVKRLIRLEQKRKLYRMIGTRLGDLNENAKGLIRVDVPLHSPNIPLSSIPDPKTWKGPWRSVTDPEEIAQYICVINTRQYNQAQHTPFGSGYLANIIGLNIEKPAAEQILNGNFSVDPSVKLLPETHRIIEYLNSPTKYNTPFPSTITVQEFQETYRMVKEKTSSSASGRHVGHYKAAAQNDALSQIHSMMMGLPYKIGFSPTRWRKIVDVMLEKDPGNPKLHRLRIIALIESDYNQSQRILIARRLTHRLEDNHLVPEMQYGSRPGKLCITPALNKQLTHDIIRQSKQTAAIIENDAVGCYDRLMNPLLLLTMRKFGVTETMAKSAGLTWSLTSHTIKTQYGVSESSYTNDPSTPLFGPSQGSTTGPTLWQLSYILLTNSVFAQREINNNMEENDDEDPIPSLGLQSVNLTDKLDNNGESFVDDSNLVSTSSIPQESHHVSTVDQISQSKSAVENLQQLAQSWEKALFSTGGAINFQKSFWFLFHWQWKNGVAKLVSPPDTLQLKLTEGNILDSPVTVPQKSVHDTYRTLGVYISPSGDVTKAIAVLVEQAKDYQARILSSTLPREAALLSYNMYLLPKLGYPLPALYLSEGTCYHIQAPTLTALLPKVHLNRNMARSIVFGPLRFGGLAIKSLYSLQSVGQVTLFVGHLRAQDKTSSLLRISISYLQLLAGSCRPILSLPLKTYELWLDSCWMVSLWRFFTRSNVTAVLKQQWLPTITRIEDIALMDHFLQQGYRHSHLQKLNRCRIYLQVITLADIVTADGGSIIPDIFEGVPLTDRKSALRWPCQQRPPAKDWALWSSALKTLQPRNKLTTPLGSWLVKQYHQVWFWYMDPILPKLYHRPCRGGCKMSRGYATARRSTRNSPPLIFDISATIEIPFPPPDLCPASISTDHYTNLTTAIRGPPFLNRPSPSLSQATWFSKPDDHPFYSSLLGTPTDLLDHLKPLAPEGITSEISAITRVLYDPPYLIISWTLFNPGGYKYSGVASRGISEGISSEKRLALEGLLAVTFLVAELRRAVKTSNGTLTLYCLSKRVTKQLNGIRYESVTTALHDHYDLLTDFKIQMKSLERTGGIQIMYLDYGNDKDTSQQYNEVGLLSTIIADHKDSLSPPSPQSYISPPNDSVTLYYQGKPLISKVVPTLRFSMYSEALRKTVRKQEQWTEVQFDSVDWPALEQALLSTWSCKRISYTKLSNKLLNTNAQNNRYYGKSDTCPCCHLARETIQHMLSCQAPEVVHFRTHQQEILRANLELIDTPSHLIDLIMLGINFQDITPQPLHHSSQDIDSLAAFTNQSILGWEAFMRGRISRTWQIAVARGHGSSKHTLKWAGKLITLLLHYSQQLWTFRCGVVHGRTTAESQQKQKLQLLQQVQAAYDEYRSDPFHIPSHWRSLFLRPFQNFSMSDRDTITCWLRSYSEAVQQQNLKEVKLQQQSKRFFNKSRGSKPTVVNTPMSCICNSDEDSESVSTSSEESDGDILDYIPFDPGPRHP